MFKKLEKYTKEELLNFLNSFEKVSDFFTFFDISDNSTNIKKFHILCEELGFDLTIYKERKKKYCLACGKELKRGQTKFCSSSCNAKYNNHKRGKMSEEIKEKIRQTWLNKKQSKENVVIPKLPKKACYCMNCNRELKGTQKKFCSSSCSSEYRHKIAYEHFLDGGDEFLSGGYTPKNFKQDILKEQNYECAIEGCHCKPEWNGKPLVFVLDHIDGDASNNRRNNLRMICPNCDSQLDTFKSKNKNSSRRNYWKENILKKNTVS